MGSPMGCWSTVSYKACKRISTSSLRNYKTQWQREPKTCFLTARGQPVNNKSSAQDSCYGNNMNILSTIICGLEVPKSCRHSLVTHSQSKWLCRKFTETLRLNVTVTVRIINRGRHSRHHVRPLIFIAFIIRSVPISVCRHTVIPPVCI